MYCFAARAVSPFNRPVPAVSRRGLGVALLAVVLAPACSRPSAVGVGAPGSLRGANVLLVTIDTLRQDRVGAYGNRAGLTPTIDRLAARGVRFAHAFTPAPLTLPAHASMLTGLLPRHHGIHNNTAFRLDDRVPTLADRLARAGYRTGALVGAFVLDGRFGLNRGFGEYDDRLPHGDRASFDYAERRAAEVVRLAGDWILQPAGGTSPWLAWVHLFDPHAPYDAPAEYRSGRAPYDAEVAYADAMLGTLVARLEAAHALDHTLVVVTADHGESLGEHGETTHGLFAYDATLSVPLVVNAPGLTTGTIDAPVSHVDLMPTVLDLLGVALDTPTDGASLVKPPSPDRAVYFEALDASVTRGWAPLRGVVQRGWKYIDLPEPELYDLNADPHEQRNLADRDAHVDVLRRVLQAASGLDAAAPRVALDGDAAARLRALGYTAGSAPDRAVTVADDPKRLVGLNERFNAALTAFDEGRPAEALAALRAILAERPDFVAARTSAATVLIAGGAPGEAVRLIEEGLARGDRSPDLRARLGRARLAAGDPRGAADALEQARSAGDGNPDVVADLAIANAALGRVDAARIIFRDLLGRNPSSATTWYNLGLLELQAKRPADAADAFRRAAAIEPGYGDAWQALGASLAASDRRGAIAAWRKAEPLRPRDYDLLFNLGMLLAGSDTPGDAIPYLQRFVREAPRPQYARDVSNVQSVLARLQAGREVRN
jgi:arylsulfatase A-like enzyme/Tfp pilus assembly protein PilF